MGVIGSVSRNTNSQLLPVLPELIYYLLIAILSICIICYLSTVARVIARNGRIKRIRCAASLLIIIALNVFVAILGAVLADSGISNAGGQLAIILFAWIVCYFVVAWWAAFLRRRSSDIER